VIKEGGAHHCWISNSALIKEMCILWVPGYVNTGSGETPKKDRTETEEEEQAPRDEIDP
jgi:hypothetical protein